MAVLDSIKNTINSIGNKNNTTSSGTASNTSSNATQKKRNGVFGANFYPR